jgi:hypothetical protein
MVRLLAGWLLFASPALRFEPRRLYREFPECATARNGCMRVRFSYLDARGGSAVARARINAAIVNFVSEEDATPEESAKGFIEHFIDSQSDDFWGPHSWEIGREVTVSHSSPTVVSFRCHEESYMGGAHPNTFITYLNFDPTTGERVELKKILREDAIPRLTALAERAFRKNREIPDGEDLEKAGFTFEPGERFSLTENYGFGKKELIFFYNSYEVAPYVMGPTVVKIPYDQIRDLFVPGFRP